GRRVQFRHLFFQAEDGIRDDLVTGVQTCALPISGPLRGSRCSSNASTGPCSHTRTACQATASSLGSRTVAGREADPSWVTSRSRSEERRVGKERHAQGREDHRNENTRREATKTIV